MSLLGLVNRELSLRENFGWTRVVIDGPEDEARMNEDIAAGRIRLPIIIRRIVSPAPRN
jgi:hypothetical protein